MSHVRTCSNWRVTVVLNVFPRVYLRQESHYNCHQHAHFSGANVCFCAKMQEYRYSSSFERKKVMKKKVMKIIALSDSINVTGLKRGWNRDIENNR